MRTTGYCAPLLKCQSYRKTHRARFSRLQGSLNTLEINELVAFLSEFLGWSYMKVRANSRYLFNALGTLVCVSIFLA